MATVHIDPAAHYNAVPTPSKRKLSECGEDEQATKVSKKRRLQVTFAKADVVHEFKKEPKMGREYISPLDMDNEIDAKIQRQANERNSGLANITLYERLSPRVVKIKISGSVMPHMVRLKLAKGTGVDVVITVNGAYSNSISTSADEFGSFNFQTAVMAKADDDVSLRIVRARTQRLIVEIEKRFD